MTISIDVIILITLYFTRISALIFSLPIFGDTPVPIQVRVLLACALTLFLFSSFPESQLLRIGNINNTAHLVYLILSEVIIGLTLGFIVKTTFASITMAASFVGYQMGFGTGDLFIQAQDGRQTSFTVLHQTLVFLIFFALNFHLTILGAIKETYTVLPINSLSINSRFIVQIISITSEIFIISMQLAAPILIAIMFSTAAMGLVARSVPQVNVFVVSFPIGFFLGLSVYLACLPFFPEWLTGHFSYMKENFNIALYNLAR